MAKLHLAGPFVFGDSKFGGLDTLECNVLSVRLEDKCMQHSGAVCDVDARLVSGSPSSQMQHVLSSRLPFLYRRAYRILGNRADAEDAVQDALLSAHKHLKEFSRRVADIDLADHYSHQ